MKTYLNFVNGQPVGSEQTFESRNPATGEVLGLAPISTASQVKSAIAAARAAQPAGAARPPGGRMGRMM